MKGGRYMRLKDTVFQDGDTLEASHLNDMLADIKEAAIYERIAINSISLDPAIGDRFKARDEEEVKLICNANKRLT